MTARGLPPALAAARDRLLTGVSRRILRDQSMGMSQRYRSTAQAHARGDEVLAYAVTRMPATYAAATAVLDELRQRLPGFAPLHLLDLGSGPGTAAWAAIEVFETLEQVTTVEREPSFRDLAARLAQDHPILEQMTQRALDLERTAEIEGRFPLVAACFMLAEIEPSRLGPVIAAAWAATAGILVLLEPGTPGGFSRIRTAREQLIAAGGHVVAPCPHDAACPMTGEDWCHFAVRLPRGRDHKHVKRAEAPFEDEKYAYVILSREPVLTIHARVIRPPRAGKVEVTAPLCMASGLIERRIPARDREAYRAAKEWRWGAALDAE